MWFDVGGLLDLFLRHPDPQVVWSDLDPAQRHERQVPADQALFDGAEHGLVGPDVDVNLFELPDLLTVKVDEGLAVPLGDVLMRGHVTASYSRPRPKHGRLTDDARRPACPPAAAATATGLAVSLLDVADSHGAFSQGESDRGHTHRHKRTGVRGPQGSRQSAYQSQVP